MHDGCELRYIQVADEWWMRLLCEIASLCSQSRKLLIATFRYVLWNKMEQLAHSLLPAFLDVDACTEVYYENGF